MVLVLPVRAVLGIKVTSECRSVCFKATFSGNCFKSVGSASQGEQ